MSGRALPVDYAGRVAVLAVERDALKASWDRLSNLRLLVFAGFAVLLGWALWVGSLPLLLAAAVAGIAFLWTVRTHRVIGRRWRRAAALHDLNAEAILRGQRAWDALPLRGEHTAPAGHPYANDLDLFGRGSLYHLLETAETPLGRERLREWLLAPADPATVQERQQAAQVQAPDLDWRQELATHGRLIGNEPPDPEPFLAWAESEPVLLHRTGLLAAAALSTAALIVLVVLRATDVIVTPLWWTPALINLMLVFGAGGPVRARLGVVATQHRAVERYAGMLEHAAKIDAKAPLLARLHVRLTAEEGTAADALARLSGLTAFVIPPSSLLYLIVQAAVCWDLFVGRALERWQRDHGPQVRAWLDTLGEIEAVSALAGLAHDNPDWVMPIDDSAADRLTSEALAHPLLAAGVRVANDVTIGPAGRYLLITGSNMSGKSTLLRAVGVNLVLAGMGAPVCAAAFRCPPVRLWTSVHVEDSLRQGVSFFMAELQRLKQIADAAVAPDAAGRPLFFLLDEILQGTNTAERQIAARRVIRALIDAGAIGAVSTHDLTLADGPELAAATVPVHLRERIEDGPDGATMHFDYRLRPGIATSTNALALMEIVFGHHGRIVHDAPKPAT